MATETVIPWKTGSFLKGYGIYFFSGTRLDGVTDRNIAIHSVQDFRKDNKYHLHAVCSEVSIDWAARAVHDLGFRSHSAPLPSRIRKVSYITNDSQSASPSWCEAPSGIRDQCFFLLEIFFRQLRDSFLWRPLCREDGSVIYCCCWSSPPQSHRTQNHILLSRFLRLPQPGRPGTRIYIPQEQGGPVTPPGTGFPSRRLLRLAGTTVEVFYPTSTRERIRNFKIHCKSWH
jgi:hypothetical protein